MYSAVPTGWFANWSEDGTNITLPIASLPQLTAAEADAATGDIRKIVFALVDKMQAAYAALASADRPTKVTITRATSVDDTTGKIRRTYSFEFELESAGEEVVAEA
ncbi:MAG: hypothetical protein ACOYOU_00865 [Kiritimatiellia bacterium]